jgi:hypothetical protein
MNELLQNVLIGVVIGVVVGLASGGDWAFFVMGLVLALSLAVMLFFGSYATRGTPGVEPRTYALAGLLSLVLGYGMYRFADSEPSWWAVGFILAGALSSAAPLARPDSREPSREQKDPQS